jgi:DNA (cytosine-5)-methyltransferase 1
MGIVLGTLVDRGYSVSWRVLDAQHFGVPQRRRRVFIVAGRTTDRRVGQILLEPEGSRRDLETSDQARQGITRDVAPSTQLFGQTGFARYTEGGTTLTATSYKRPEDNVVVRKN